FATEFDRETYYSTLTNAAAIGPTLESHLAVMDRFDPDHRVGLIIDEWGAWYDVEPGTNPGFLYQQNTMRDAMVAGETLNIFNNHSDRVVMANIAQMVNVLQAVILTEGKKMLLTPTYHVFDLYKGHQDAVLLETEYETRAIGLGEAGIPDLSVSASRGADGEIRATLVNPDPQNALEIGLKIAGADPENASARGIAGGIADHNTFEEPERVKIRPTAVSREADGVFTVRLPACSVTEVVLS
ncbi:MAG: alpha-N-arabinofuranosidase, partial [Clostridia bacterium]|nr:alpha-N-arabinofuranosidase [Clostridia bacterium]